MELNTKVVSTDTVVHHLKEMKKLGVECLEVTLHTTNKNFVSLKYVSNDTGYVEDISELHLTLESLGELDLNVDFFSLLPPISCRGAVWVGHVMPQTEVFFESTIITGLSKDQHTGQIVVNDSGVFSDKLGKVEVCRGIPRTLLKETTVVSAEKSL